MKKIIFILCLALTFTSCEQISKKIDEISATDVSTDQTEIEFPIPGTWYVEDSEKEVENTAFNFIEYTFETPTNVDGKLTGVVHTISNDPANPSRTGSYEVLTENKLILSFPNESPQDFIYSYNPEYQKVDISFAGQNRILTNTKTIVQERCPEGSIELITQADVDQFVIDYPNCTKISKDLYIGSGDITNLSGLSSLKTVEGDLEIFENSVLTNLKGLNNLTSIGGFLVIYQNTALTNLDELSSLKSIGDYLMIDRNPQLEDISGLQNLDPSTIKGTSNGMMILSNHKLAVCNLPNFCTYLSNPKETHPRNIRGNLANCEEKALENACL